MFYSVFERVLYVFMEFYTIILVVRVECSCFLSVVYVALLTLVTFDFPWLYHSKKSPPASHQQTNLHIVLSNTKNTKFIGTWRGTSHEKYMQMHELVLQDHE